MNIFAIGIFLWILLCSSARPSVRNVIPRGIALLQKCPNTEFFLVRIQSECGKIQTRKNSVFGHFSRSVGVSVFSNFLHEVRNKGGKVTEPDFGKRLTFQEGPRSLKNGPEMSFLKFSKILSIHMFFFLLKYEVLMVV